MVHLIAAFNNHIHPCIVSWALLSALHKVPQKGNQKLCAEVLPTDAVQLNKIIGGCILNIQRYASEGPVRLWFHIERKNQLLVWC